MKLAFKDQTAQLGEVRLWTPGIPLGPTRPTYTSHSLAIDQLTIRYIFPINLTRVRHVHVHVHVAELLNACRKFRLIEKMG